MKKLFALMVVVALTAVGCDDKKTSVPAKITPPPSGKADPKPEVKPEEKPPEEKKKEDK